MDKSHEGIPYGPLTLENFETLAGSFYDASREDAQRIARQRGIQSGNLVEYRIGKMTAQAAKNSEEAVLEDEAPDA